MRIFLSLYGPLIFWCALIFTLSSIPGLKISESFWDFFLRKGAHIFMFFVLFLLTYKAHPSFIGGFVFSTFYALSDEIHQSFVPNRSGNLGDFLIDLAGILLAIVFIKIYEERRSP